ncbi:hypothetical protein EDB86DRAFT_2833430 [Lactarius hatsudake]|nr:hypothetical protein EDB86DRAFT_2833430 [Lactarius hatsudake]
MDIDTIATVPSPRSPRTTTPLSDADRERCRREGRCFRCLQVGHLATLCPRKPRQSGTRFPPVQANTISLIPPVAASTTSPVAQSAASAAMTHILGLDEEARQSVINNLLLMEMNDFAPDVATPQINAIELRFAPSPLVTPSGMNAMQLELVSSDAIPTPVTPPFLPDLASLSLTDSPPPRPPRSPRRPYSPRLVSPPLPVVEDDNVPTGGVKTSPSTHLASVLDRVTPLDELPHALTPVKPQPQTIPVHFPPPRPPRPPRSPLRDYRPIFLASAFERPRDPDEVRPQGPQPLPVPRPRHTDRRDRANAADVTPTLANPATLHTTTRNREPNLVVMHDRDQQTQGPGARRLRRTLYATNNDIHTWLQQIVHNNAPPRPRFRPSPSRGSISEERTDTDPELREYRYDRTYDHADAELGG